MSLWVRSSQIARWRCAQFAAALEPVSPGQAATFSRVRLSNLVAPLEVNVMFTTQEVPVESMVAVELEISSPVSPVRAGLKPASGPVVTFASGTHFVYTSFDTAPIVFWA